MKGLGGRTAIVTAIVNIASDAGRVGSSGEAVYAACKGGLIAFTKTLARELASAEVRVNAVCPGPTETPLFQSFLGEGEKGKQLYEALRRAIPFRRFGQPDDAAGIAAFLASDDAPYVSYDWRSHGLRGHPARRARRDRHHHDRPAEGDERVPKPHL